MAAQLPVQDAIEKFLADYKNLAGSRDGFPALALSLNRARDLHEHIAELYKQIEFLKLSNKYWLKRAEFRNSPMQMEYILRDRNEYILKNREINK